jgi:hypothetical protein
MRRLRSALAATALALTCTLLHAQTAPPGYAPAAAPNTASLSTPISPAKLAKIDEMLTLTGVIPTRLKTIDHGKERLNWNAKVQAGTLTQVPKEKQAKEREQLDGIIAFYKSPAGKAMLEKGPALNQRTYDALQALQVHAKPLTDQATKDMQDKVQALRPATPVPPRPSASATPSTTSSASPGPQQH